MTSRWSSSIAGMVLLLAGCGSTVHLSQPVSTAARRVYRDIEYLASVKLGGREPGRPGADSAAVFIGQQFLDLQLLPAFISCDSGGTCNRQLYQYFILPSPWNHIAAVNVGAIVPGADPSVRHEIIVIGAHYDHLGRSTTFARDTLAIGIRVGADDNASGTAAVLELARRFAERPPRRSVLLIAFGAEEYGLIGSNVFVDNSPVSLDSMTAMLNLDMIGRLRSQGVIVHGLDTSPLLDALLDSANVAIQLPLRKRPDIGRSDQVSFSAHGIPAVHFFTGEHSDYHTLGDRPDRLNVSGLVSIINVAELLARLIADYPALLPRRE